MRANPCAAERQLALTGPDHRPNPIRRLTRQIHANAYAAHTSPSLVFVVGPAHLSVLRFRFWEAFCMFFSFYRIFSRFCWVLFIFPFCFSFPPSIFLFFFFFFNECFLDWRKRISNFMNIFQIRETFSNPWTFFLSANFCEIHDFFKIQNLFKIHDHLFKSANFFQFREHFFKAVIFLIHFFCKSVNNLFESTNFFQLRELFSNSWKNFKLENFLQKCTVFSNSTFFWVHKLL